MSTILGCECHEVNGQHAAWCPAHPKNNKKSAPVAHENAGQAEEHNKFGVTRTLPNSPLGQATKVWPTPAAAPEPREQGDVFDFVGRKMATHLVETLGALEGFDDPIRAAGQSALEEFWFRATGHHIDWVSLQPEIKANMTQSLAAARASGEEGQVKGEDAWLDEFVEAAGAADAETRIACKRVFRTILRAFAANLKRQLAAPSSSKQRCGKC